MKAKTARKFMINTCPASRHVQIMADNLLRHGSYSMFAEDPEHCASSLQSVVESLWRARDELIRLKGIWP